MEYIEYEFEVKNIDIQVQKIEAEIASLQLEKDRFNYEKVKLANAYNTYVAINQSVPTYVDGITPIITDASDGNKEELKPRRLKKND